ncbi:hypothetical protein JCM31598_15880 [Desulfonatronum parangueonense]
MQIKASLVVDALEYPTRCMRKYVIAQKDRAMKFPVQGYSIDAEFREKATGAMLQPELCPECVTPLPHWGAVLPGFIPLFATSF